MKNTLYDNEGHKLDMRIILFCPTIMSSANPIYETLKYLDEDDIVICNGFIHWIIRMIN